MKNNLNKKDTRLYQGLLNRDEQILGEFIKAYHPIFFHTGISMIKPYGTEEDISDAVAESIWYIWCNIEKYDSEKSSFKYWCLLIFRSRLMNQIDKNKLEAKRIQKSSIKIYESDAEQIIIDKEHMNIVLNAIVQLKPPKNIIFFMKYINHKSVCEIAETLDLSVKQIYRHLDKGKKMLKELLSYEKKYL